MEYFNYINSELFVTITAAILTANAIMFVAKAIAGVGSYHAASDFQGVSGNRKSIEAHPQVCEADSAAEKP